MLRVLSADRDLGDYSYDCYAYPTRLFRFPFGPRMPGIQEISRGLRTFIETSHAQKDRITLVGHSMGGVVARQFIVDELKKQRAARIAGVVLYASPNSGAALAGLGRLSSWRHRQFRQLSRDSDLLDSLNSDWIGLAVERQVKTLYVVGGADSVVDPSSASGQPGAENVAILIEDTHRTIVDPADDADISFQVLKKFIALQMRVPGGGPAVRNPSQGSDVLFDVYSPAVAPFYVEREEDGLIGTAARCSHVWVSGPSGLGKTAALRRLVDRPGWQIQHITLGSYLGLDALALIRAICNELHERAGCAGAGPEEHSKLPQLLGHFRRILRHLSGSGPVAIVVEEIPLSSGEDYSRLLGVIAHLATASETDGTPARVLWLFSSIRDPRLSLPPDPAKFLERVQLVNFQRWSDVDILRLTQLIDGELGLDLSAADRRLIVARANGSPRFVKMVFRARRNEAGSRRSLPELIADVEPFMANHA